MLVLLQYATQNIALFCAALYGGSVVYVTLVEHPTITAGGAKLADAYLLFAHPRPLVMQTAFGLAGAVSAILAGVCGGSPWWLAGGTLLGAAAALHVSVVTPLT